MEVAKYLLFAPSVKALELSIAPIAMAPVPRSVLGVGDRVERSVRIVMVQAGRSVLGAGVKATRSVLGVGAMVLTHGERFVHGVMDPGT